MILVRTPLRVSFAGGGTDLPAWYQQGEPGAVVNAAIGAYIYITLSSHWHEDRVRISYSVTENVEGIRDIRHDLIRECMNHFGMGTGIEITSIGQIPGKGSGLGSSSSYTVGIYHALAAHRGMKPSPEWLAEAACLVELTMLRHPGGKQDQYAAAFGGLNYMRFDPGGTVEVEPLDLSSDVLRKMERSMPLYYTGIHRRSRQVLTETARRLSKTKHVKSEARAMVGLASQARDALSNGRLSDLGLIMHEGWERKRRFSERVSRNEIDLMYERALKAGAVGGKLCGAGGGGFLLFYIPEDKIGAVDSALKRRRIHVRYGVPGSEVVFRDEPTF